MTFDQSISPCILFHLFIYLFFTLSLFCFVVLCFFFPFHFLAIADSAYHVRAH